MDRTAIINTVLSRLGRKEGNTYLVAAAQTELGLIQDMLEGGAFLPWFLLSGELTSYATAANTRTINLPATFLREYEDFPVYRYDSTASPSYIELVKDEFDVLQQKYGDDTNDIPLEYALVGTQLHFFPTPNAVYPLRVQWYQKDAALSSGNLTNQWTANAADLLIAKLGYVMAGYVRDQVMRDIFLRDETVAFARLLSFDEARKQAARDAFRGDRA